MVYNFCVVEMLKTAEFDTWLSKLRDRQAVARITARIDRLTSGADIKRAIGLANGWKD
jgi:putative component of toxin-antitoxin plasmid stabilization module